MSVQPGRPLLEVLRQILMNLEDFGRPDNPGRAELRNLLRLRIEELEIARSELEMKPPNPSARWHLK
jgi:hypothetical protein